MRAREAMILPRQLSRVTFSLFTNTAWHGASLDLHIVQYIYYYFAITDLLYRSLLLTNLS